MLKVIKQRTRGDGNAPDKKGVVWLNPQNGEFIAELKDMLKVMVELCIANRLSLEWDGEEVGAVETQGITARDDIKTVVRLTAKGKKLIKELKEQEKWGFSH